MKLKNFFEKIIRRDTAESSKRLVALATLLLIAYIVLRFTNTENFLSTLNSLLIFESALLGISSIETVTMHKGGVKKQGQDENTNN